LRFLQIRLNWQIQKERRKAQSAWLEKGRRGLQDCMYVKKTRDQKPEKAIAMLHPALEERKRK